MLSAVVVVTEDALPFLLVFSMVRYTKNAGRQMRNMN